MLRLCGTANSLNVEFNVQSSVYGVHVRTVWFVYMVVFVMGPAARV